MSIRAINGANPLPWRSLAVASERRPFTVAYCARVGEACRIF